MYLPLVVKEGLEGVVGSAMMFSFFTRMQWQPVNQWRVFRTFTRHYSHINRPQPIPQETSDQVEHFIKHFHKDVLAKGTFIVVSSF